MKEGAPQEKLMPRVSIADLVEAARRGDSFDSQEFINADEKAKRFALAVPFIEEAWSVAYGEIKKNVLGREKDEEDLNAFMGEVREISEIVLLLENISLRFILAVVDSRHQLEGEKIGEVLRGILETQNNFAQTDKIKTFIEGGFQTALGSIWWFLSIIPQVYEQQKGRSITGEETLTIARESRDFIKAMAAMEFGNFMNRIAQGALSHSPDGSLTQIFDVEVGLIPPDPSDFYSIVPTAKGFKFAPKEDVTASYEDQAQKDQQRYGCPAFYAKSPDGKNVIDSLYDWQLAVAEKYYAPTIDKLNQKNA